MRTFIAIPLPKFVKNMLQNMQFATDDIRWQPVHQMHITLKFLGEISQQKLDALFKALADIDQKSFRLTVEGWGTFPEKGVPKVLWAGISRGQELMKLQRNIEDECKSLNFEPENQPFIPHVTLGRLRKHISRKEIKKIVDTPTHSEFSVTMFNVYQSELNPEGAVHTLIKKYPLPDH